MEYRRAIYVPRKDGHWAAKLRPGVLEREGQVFHVTFGWYITADDRKDYAGEIAWMPHIDDHWAHGWIASGDLVFLDETRPKELMAVANAEEAK